MFEAISDKIDYTHISEDAQRNSGKNLSVNTKIKRWATGYQHCQRKEKVNVSEI